MTNAAFAAFLNRRTAERDSEFDYVKSTAFEGLASMIREFDRLSVSMLVAEDQRYEVDDGRSYTLPQFHAACADYLEVVKRIGEGLASVKDAETFDEFRNFCSDIGQLAILIEKDANAACIETEIQRFSGMVLESTNALAAIKTSFRGGFEAGRAVRQDRRPGHGGSGLGPRR